LYCIERSDNESYNAEVPSLTDARIEEITANIRKICAEPFTPQAEARLRSLAEELRVVINQHVRMAKSSLSTKKAAIDLRDADQRDPGEK
jgi:hypothetical protein